MTLINIKENLKEQVADQRDNWQVSVKADSQKSLPLKQNHKFKPEEQDKLKVNPRHLTHYILLWIACVDDYYNLHYILKAKHSKYPKRTEWDSSEKKF